MFQKSNNFVVNSGRYRRHRGAEWPKSAYHYAALRLGEFGESGSNVDFAAAFRCSRVDPRTVDAINRKNRRC